MAKISGDNEKDTTYSQEGFKRRAEWFRETRREKTNEHGLLVPGGADSFDLEREVQSNYINAQYLSTIITAASVIEGMLYQQVAFIEREKKEEETHTLGSIIRLAKEFDIISRDVTGAFDKLKDISNLRNAVVHYREGHEEDALLPKELKDFEGFHPNRYGKEYAERMIQAMFDIKAKCHENQQGVFGDEGPLVQGLDHVKTGKEVYCGNCGASLKDRKLDYTAEWDGNEVVDKSAECPVCGQNVISKIRNQN